MEQARLPAIMRVSKPMTLRTVVPACPSSPIPAVAHRLTAPAMLVPDQCRSLLDDLTQIADPRHRRGRRHPLATVLAVAVAAVLAGAKSLAAIGEWAADAPGRSWPHSGRAAIRCARSGSHPARPPSAGCWPASTPTRWTRSSAGGWPTSSHPHRPPGRHRQPGRRGGRRPPSTARPCAARSSRHVAGAPAGRDGPHHPRGPGPDRRRPRHGRDCLVPAAA
jgi:hypothetical protein